VESRADDDHNQRPSCAFGDLLDWLRDWCDHGAATKDAPQLLGRPQCVWLGAIEIDLREANGVWRVRDTVVTEPLDDEASFCEFRAYASGES